MAATPPLQAVVLDRASDAPTLTSAINIGAFNFGNPLAAWLAGAAIGAGFGYASANIVGAMMTAAGLALAFVTLRLDARERRHI